MSGLRESLPSLWTGRVPSFVFMDRRSLSTLFGQEESVSRVKMVGVSILFCVSEYLALVRTRGVFLFFAVRVV